MVVVGATGRVPDKEALFVETRMFCETAPVACPLTDRVSPSETSALVGSATNKTNAMTITKNVENFAHTDLEGLL